jgi:hypothetical protein
MHRDRVFRRLSEAGIDPTPSPERRTDALSKLADDVLERCGIPRDRVHQIASTLWSAPRTSAAAAALGAGFGAWTLSHSDELLIHATERGVEIAGFIHDNIDLLTAGWDTAAPAVADFLVEFTLNLPEGTVHLGEQILHLLDHGEAAGHAASVDFADVGDALHAVEAGVTLTDVAEGVATVGASIAAGWLAKKAVERHYQPLIEQRRARLGELEREGGEVARLGASLRGGVPPAVVAAQLAKVDTRHWAF